MVTSKCIFSISLFSLDFKYFEAKSPIESIVSKFYNNSNSLRVGAPAPERMSHETDLQIPEIPLHPTGGLFQ